MEFKFTLLTPWVLLPDKLPDEACNDSNAAQFARLLSERTIHELKRFSFWPQARGEAFIRNSFDEFEERFLKHSEYAVLIMSGQFAHCLDYLYPRLLVFLTRRPSWTERFLIVFLGVPEINLKFDFKIFKNEPIIFNGEASNQWQEDVNAWIRLFGVLRQNYVPISPDYTIKTNETRQDQNRNPTWMSVTDLRGRPFAVRITETGSQTSLSPSSSDHLVSRSQLRASAPPMGVDHETIIRPLSSQSLVLYNEPIMCHPHTSRNAPIRAPYYRVGSLSPTVVRSKSLLSYAIDEPSSPTSQVDSNTSPAFKRPRYKNLSLQFVTSNENRIDEKVEDLICCALPHYLEHHAEDANNCLEHRKVFSHMGFGIPLCQSSRCSGRSLKRSRVSRSTDSLDSIEYRTSTPLKSGRKKKSGKVITLKRPVSDESLTQKDERKKVLGLFKCYRKEKKGDVKKQDRFGSKSKVVLGETVKTLANMSANVISGTKFVHNHVIINREHAGSGNFGTKHSELVTSDKQMYFKGAESEPSEEITHLLITNSVPNYYSGTRVPITGTSTNEIIIETSDISHLDNDHKAANDISYTSMKLLEPKSRQSTPTISARFADSGHWSMSQMVSEGGTDDNPPAWTSISNPTSPITVPYQKPNRKVHSCEPVELQSYTSSTSSTLMAHLKSPEVSQRPCTTQFTEQNCSEDNSQQTSHELEELEDIRSDPADSVSETESSAYNSNSNTRIAPLAVHEVFHLESASSNYKKSNSPSRTSNISDFDKSSAISDQISNSAGIKTFVVNKFNTEIEHSKFRDEASFSLNSANQMNDDPTTALLNRPAMSQFQMKSFENFKPNEAQLNFESDYVSETCTEIQANLMHIAKLSDSKDTDTEIPYFTDETILETLPSHVYTEEQDLYRVDSINPVQHVTEFKNIQTDEVKLSMVAGPVHDVAFSQTTSDQIYFNACSMQKLVVQDIALHNLSSIHMESVLIAENSEKPGIQPSEVQTDINFIEFGSEISSSMTENLDQESQLTDASDPKEELESTSHKNPRLSTRTESKEVLYDPSSEINTIRRPDSPESENLQTFEGNFLEIGSFTTTNVKLVEYSGSNGSGNPTDKNGCVDTLCANVQREIALSNFHEAVTESTVKPNDSEQLGSNNIALVSADSHLAPQLEECERTSLAIDLDKSTDLNQVLQSADQELGEDISIKDECSSFEVKKESESMNLKTITANDQIKPIFGMKTSDETVGMIHTSEMDNVENSYDPLVVKKTRTAIYSAPVVSNEESILDFQPESSETSKQTSEELETPSKEEKVGMVEIDCSDAKNGQSVVHIIPSLNEEKLADDKTISKGDMDANSIVLTSSVKSVAELQFSLSETNQQGSNNEIRIDPEGMISDAEGEIQMFGVDICTKEPVNYLLKNEDQSEKTGDFVEPLQPKAFPFEQNDVTSRAMAQDPLVLDSLPENSTQNFRLIEPMIYELKDFSTSRWQSDFQSKCSRSDTDNHPHSHYGRENITPGCSSNSSNEVATEPLSLELGQTLPLVIANQKKSVTEKQTRNDTSDDKQNASLISVPNQSIMESALSKEMMNNSNDVGQQIIVPKAMNLSALTDTNFATFNEQTGPNNIESTIDQTRNLGKMEDVGLLFKSASMTTGRTVLDGEASSIDGGLSSTVPDQEGCLGYPSSFLNAPPNDTNQYESNSTSIMTTRSLLIMDSPLEYIPNISTSLISDNTQIGNQLENISISDSPTNCELGQSEYLELGEQPANKLINVDVQPAQYLNQTNLLTICPENDVPISSVCELRAGNLSSQMNQESNQSENESQSSQLSSLVPNRWTIWNPLSDLLNLATLYLPRHIYWFYGATFETRQQLHRIMSGRAMYLIDSTTNGITHPAGVAVLFICITIASPFIDRWSRVLVTSVSSTELFVFDPVLWLDRPILWYLNHLIHSVPHTAHWSGRAFIRLFRQPRWALANPVP